MTVIKKTPTAPAIIVICEASWRPIARCNSQIQLDGPLHSVFFPHLLHVSCAEIAHYCVIFSFFLLRFHELRNAGKNLSAPQQFRSKEISKRNVVDDVVDSNPLLYA